MSHIKFTVPVKRVGAPLEFIAYYSTARRNTFIVASANTGAVKPLLSAFHEHSRFARHELGNFTQLKLTALYEDDKADSAVHAIEVMVVWRGIEKFKAVYSINDATSEIFFNRWENDK